MIRFITTSANGYTVNALDETFGGALPECEALSYHALFSLDDFVSGTYIFCDLERLSHHELVLAGAYHHALRGKPGIRLLNDPARVRTRYALLRALHQAGFNDFDVHRADGLPKPRRFPVFVRAEAVHEAALTDLLPDQPSLDAALERLMSKGHSLRGLLVIEFCAEPIAPGIYRRWGTFAVADRIHLDHIVTEDSWNVKWGRPGLVGDEVYRSDDHAVHSNRYETELREAFRIAGVDYGRADFGLVGGRPQIYEINTNPFIGRLADHPSPVRQATMAFAHRRFAEYLVAIDTMGDQAAARIDRSDFSPEAEIAYQSLARERRHVGSGHGGVASSATNDPPAGPSAKTPIGAGMDALHAENAALRETVSALRGSTSWKITAPMRGLSRLARRLALPVVRRRQKAAAICILRDAVDLVPLLCGHYLGMGVDRLIFIDDGSTDGTYELLRRIASKSRRVTIRRLDEKILKQTAEMTAAANAAIAAGYHVIIPFDADEFWDIGPQAFRTLLEDPSPRVVRAPWRNFVARRTARAPSAVDLLGVRHRAPQMADGGMEKILRFEEPFVGCLQHKVAVVSPAPIHFLPGQHGLQEGPDRVDGLAAEVFHLPLRYRSEITKRGLNYEPRRAPMRQDAQQSWQSKFHAQVVCEHRVDEVWAANSVDEHGRLDVYGDVRDAIPDDRLAQHLLAAQRFMSKRHGISLK